jgi:hypothetical protein
MALARGARLARGGGPVPWERSLSAASDPAARGPVIVLAPAYAGASQLRYLLEGHPDLACTSGTGILPLCEQAMAAWGNADGPGARSPSALAVTATRALATSIITAVLAREGKPRWCEVANANIPAAETFLRLYPQARFVCLHRACPGVIRAALDASPWGIADPAFAPFIRAYPASTVAALTAYWVAHTGPLLAFEQSHPQTCLRVRFEDLAAARHQTAEQMTSFLSIASLSMASLDGQATTAQDNDEPREKPGNCAPEPDFPAGLIPPAMRTQANDLLRQLGYPALPADSAADSSR